MIRRSGNRDLFYRLRSLPSAATLLHLGAHPDDEDAAMMARLSRGESVRTVYWSATRGEGGQNLDGNERDEALGIVRTWETLAARRIDGAETLYGPFYDFGFCKSGAAALARWGREELTREVVRAIRTVRPQVVVTRWSGDPADGHGHHQAVGMVVEDAFEAAGEESRYPEIGLPSWRPDRLYASIGGDWQMGEASYAGDRIDEPGVVNVDIAAVDPVSGLSFEEMACIGLGRHRSQGLGIVPAAGPRYACYRLVRPAQAPGDSLFAGVDVSLASMSDEPAVRALLADGQAAAERAVELFRPDDPSRSVPALLDGLRALREAARKAGDDGPIAAKAAAFEDAVCWCLGVTARCEIDRPRVSPGGRVTATVQLGLPASVRAGQVRLELPDGWTAEETAPGTFHIGVPESAPFTTPSWLAQPRDGERYARARAAMTPLDEPLVVAACEIDVTGETLTIRAPAVRSEAFPGGFRHRALSVVPPIALHPEIPRVLRAARLDDRHLTLVVSAESMQDSDAEGLLFLELPDGWEAHPTTTELACAAGERTVVRHRVVLPETIAPGAYTLRYRIESNGLRYGVTAQPVRRGSGGLPADEATATMDATLIAPADVTVNVVDCSFATSLRYGYIAGMDETLPAALRQLGVDVVSLADEDITDLERFDGIVVGPRAYVLRQELRRNAARLLDWVAAGGTLIVQYQGYGYDAGGLAPYPLAYSHPHDRVTDPRAAVTVLEPDDSVFTTPNAIGEDDFDGWVHDRGLYFFGEWDPRYRPLLACADEGEDPRAGGLMIAAVGRGVYVHAAYSFFRQIPAGVPGAVRLFANILALPDARIRERMQALGTVPLFATTAEDERYQIARLAAERWFAAGALLCREGERSDEMFLVLEGTVDVLRGESSVASAGPGAVIGELAVIADVPRTASLRAREHVKTLALRGEHLRPLLADRPELSQRMLTILAAKLADGVAE